MTPDTSSKPSELAPARLARNANKAPALIAGQRIVAIFYGPDRERYAEHIGTLLARAERAEAQSAALAEALEAMPAACETLMDEVTGKRAANWGTVNGALVNARAALAAYRGGGK